jgi:hypothetical protein
LMIAIPLIIYQFRKPSWMPVKDINKNSELVETSYLH